MARMTSTKSLITHCEYEKLTEDKREKVVLSEAELMDIYKRLQEYENTGICPDEIYAIKAENERLHQLVDFFENVVGKGSHNDR